MREIIDAHFTVETAAAELATKYATVADIGELRGLLKVATERLAQSDMKGFIDGILVFHAGLARASHNRALAAQLKGYLDVLMDFYQERATPQRGKRVVGLLNQVVEEIVRRDREKTRGLMIQLFAPLEKIN